MEQEAKQKWVSALRSGEYQQATGQLKQDNAYCCLGVLGEVCGLNIHNNGTYFISNGQIGHGAAYPELLSFGIESREQDKLIKMNDNEGKDFMAIADYVEQNL